MESVAGSVMVRSGQDFQCYISHMQLPSLSWYLSNAVAERWATDAWGPQGLCARHCTASPTPCLPLQELGRQHPASLLGSCGMAGGLWGAVTAGSQKGWFASWKGRVSLQSMPFVPSRLCSWDRRMGWGRFVVEAFKAGFLSDPLLTCASFLIPRVFLSLVSLGYIIPFEQSC